MASQRSQTRVRSLKPWALDRKLVVSISAIAASIIEGRPGMAAGAGSDPPHAWASGPPAPRLRGRVDLVEHGPRIGAESRHRAEGARLAVEHGRRRRIGDLALRRL